MIKLSVLYPKTEGATFDHDYYRDKHVPAAEAAWSPVRTEIDKGVDGPYAAAVHFTFASRDALNAALGSPDSAAINADVPNYTTITPIIQISEVVGG